MPIADDIVQEKKNAEASKRQADKHALAQKDLIRRQVADLEKQISDLQALKSKANAELSKLAA